MHRAGLVAVYGVLPNPPHAVRRMRGVGQKTPSSASSPIYLPPNPVECTKYHGVLLDHIGNVSNLPCSNACESRYPSHPSMTDAYTRRKSVVWSKLSPASSWIRLTGSP